MDHRRPALIFLTGMLILGTISLGAAGTTYELTVSDTVDIPTQQVSIEGTEYSFTSVGKVDSSGTITADVSGPSDTLFSVLLYNNDEQIVDSQRVNGSGRVTFDAGPLSPGTYVIAVEGADGQIKKIQPVVVKGYSVGIFAPNSVTVGETITVNVTVSQVDSSSRSLSSVTVAIFEGGDHTEITASKVATDTYQATVTLDHTGTFGIYAGARGQETIDGEKQLVGISNKSTIFVEHEATDTATSGSSDGTGGTAEDSPTVSPTATPTVSPTATPQDASPQTSSTVELTSTFGDSHSPTKPTETTAVLTPVTSAAPTEQPTTVSTPLTSVRWIILLVLVAATIQRVRRP